MKSTYENWNKNLMVCEPCDDGLYKVEIDESKIETYDGKVRWMFGIANRRRYDVRIFFVDDNRSHETLIPIVKKYISILFLMLL